MTSRRFTDLSDDALRVVNAACDAFEKSLADQQAARIEDHLASATPDIQGALFCELLAIEVEWRQSSGQAFEIGEYRGRFPEFEQQIRQVFDRVASAHSPTNVSPMPASDGDLADTVSGEVDAQELKRGDAIRYMGDYEIQGLLGKGGMGVVYAARQISLNRSVALKMIKAGVLETDDGLRRFRNEADAVAMLDHPGIVPIYEVGEHDGQHYFSMKLIEGGSLDSRLKDYVKDPRAAARLMAEAADAIAHAHTRGILHRDLKPANILMDVEGHPHVTDFGLAKQVEATADTELTQSGQILGTPAFMSPEQASGHKGMITTASDVYGLGAVLYAVLTGKAPFGGDSVVDTLDAVRNTPPIAPGRLNDNTPRDLETITLCCLEKDPRRRYPTAQAVADDLRAWLDHRPISARRVGTVERAFLWCKRRPAVAGLSAATLIAIVAGTASVITVQAASNRKLAAENIVTKNAEDLAEKRLDRAMASINDYYTGFSKDAITSEQIPLALRQQLLEKPRQFYEELTNDLAGNKDATSRERRLLAAGKLSLGEILLLLGRHDEARVQTNEAVEQFEAIVGTIGSDQSASNAGLATGYNRLSDILRAEGDNNAAREPLSKAIELGESLVLSEPNEPAFRTLLAGAYSDMGNLQQAVGETPAAQASHQKSIDQFTILTKTDPENQNHLQAIASGYSNLGLALTATSDWPAAQTAYARAIEAQKKLFANNPDNPDFLNSLAASYTNLGLLLHSKADYQAALDPHRKAVEYYETLAAQHPGVPDYLDGLAGGFTNLGRSYTLTGQTEDATEANRNAIERYKMLVASRPNVPDYKEGLARSYTNLGAALNDQNQKAAATEAYLQSIEIGKSLIAAQNDIPEYQYLLAVTYVNLATIHQADGDRVAAKTAYVDAIGVLDNLLKDHPDEPNYQYALSVFHINLGQLLQEQGDSAGALKEFQRSQKTAIEGTPVANELPKAILEAEAEVAAIDRLPAVLAGDEQPRDTAERLTFAKLCYRRSQHIAAVGFWEQALKDDPALSKDRQADHRVEAASAALMAAAGHDKTNPAPDATERSALRAKAHSWLTAELNDWTAFLPTVPAEARPGIIRNLSFWQANKHLASVSEPYESLSENERVQWRAFWESYNRVLKTDIANP